ncbi:MAG: YfiR family protein [Desulfobulbaceae bacterium]|nr:YfiR family protein [Desulfobulbaceae bacterium]
MSLKQAHTARYIEISVLFSLVLLWTFFSHAPLFAQLRTEYAVKAAFILNFAMLTRWPETSFSTPDKEMKLCVAGGNELPKSFTSIDGKRVDEKKLHVVEVVSSTNLSDCDIIFFRKEIKTEDLVRMLNIVREKPVLTIGEKENITRLGGNIEFYQKQGKLRFAINPSSVAKQGLDVSSRLLKAATLVNN